MQAPLKVQVVDVGARYGIHPSLRPLLDQCDTVLIEPDPEEAARLKSQYSNSLNVRVMSVALGRVETASQLLLRRHRGLSGFMNAAVDAVGYLDVADFQLERTVEVEVLPLRSVLSGIPAFVKIDCEGAELDILSSAEDKIGCIFGIRTEVSFKQIWKDSSTFEHIHDFLTSRDFELLCFDSTEVGEEWGLISLPTSKKHLVTADALYIRNPNQLDSNEKLCAISLFCYLNGAEGLGFELLSKAKPGSLHSMTISKAGCEELLYAYVLRHLVEARKLPFYGSKVVNFWHAEIFGSSFPNRGEIYSRLLKANLVLQ